MAPGPTNKPPRSRSRAPADPRAEPTLPKLEPTVDSTRSSGRTKAARPVADAPAENAATLHRRVASLHTELADAQAQIARLEEESENEAGRIGEMLKSIADAERQARAAEDRAKAAEQSLADVGSRIAETERAAQEELEASRVRLADTQKWLDAERLLKEEMREARDDERRRAEFAQTAQKQQLDRLTDELEIERASTGDLRRTAAENATAAASLRAELAAVHEDMADAIEKARTAAEVELVLAHDRALENLRAQQSRDLAIFGEQHERATAELRAQHDGVLSSLQQRLDATDAQLAARSRALGAAEGRLEEVTHEVASARGEVDELEASLASLRRSRDAIDVELTAARSRIAEATAVIEGLGRSEALITAADDALAELDKREQDAHRARTKAFAAARKLIVAVEDLRRKGETAPG